MEQLTGLFNYLMGPVDAVVTFGGSMAHNIIELASETYRSLLR